MPPTMSRRVAVATVLGAVAAPLVVHGERTAPTFNASYEGLRARGARGWAPRLPVAGAPSMIATPEPGARRGALDGGPHYQGGRP
jgi:hypothetical protein